MLQIDRLKLETVPRHFIGLHSNHQVIWISAAQLNSPLRAGSDLEQMRVDKLGGA